MSSPARRRVALAVNPTAGNGRGARAEAAATQALTDAGLDVVRLVGENELELAERIRATLASGADVLVVVGGDGMVNLGANAVACTDVPLGIVPAGSGNDNAVTLGLPRQDPARAAEILATAIVTGSGRRIDAARCTWAGGSRWLVGVLGAGFDAIVNERVNEWSWPRGRARYVGGILRELPVFRPRPYDLDLDGDLWSTPAMLVAVGNGPSYGGGMRVCPDASLDDGLLDVMVVEPMSRPAFLRIFPRVYSGTHVSYRTVTIRRARSVTVSAPGIVGYGDGERFGPLPMTVEAVPGALHVLVPVSGAPGSV